MQEDETADRRFQGSLHAPLPLLIFILIAVGLMDEEGLPTRYGFLINTTFAYLQTCLKRLPMRCHTLTNTALAAPQSSFKRLPTRHPFLPYRPGSIGKAGVILLQPSLQLLGGQMVEEEVAPRGWLFGGGDALHCKFMSGYSFYFPSRHTVSPEDVEAIGNAPAFLVGGRKRFRAIQRHDSLPILCLLLRPSVAFDTAQPFPFLFP